MEEHYDPKASVIWQCAWDHRLPSQSVWKIHSCIHLSCQKWRLILLYRKMETFPKLSLGLLHAQYFFTNSKCLSIMPCLACTLYNVFTCIFGIIFNFVCYICNMNFSFGYFPSPYREAYEENPRKMAYLEHPASGPTNTINKNALYVDF